MQTCVEKSLNFEPVVMGTALSIGGDQAEKSKSNRSGRLNESKNNRFCSSGENNSWFVGSMYAQRTKTRGSRGEGQYSSSSALYKKIRPVSYSRFPSALASILMLLLLCGGIFDQFVLKVNFTQDSIHPGWNSPIVPVQKASLAVSGQDGVVSDVVFTQHRIVRGETLSRIAYEYGLSPSTLISVNQLEHPEDLKEDVVLTIPYRDGVRLEGGSREYVMDVARRFGVDSRLIQTFSGGDIFVPGISQDQSMPMVFVDDMFRYPVLGPVLTAFGSGVDELTGISYESQGIDFSVEKGSPVGASRSGEIILTGHHASYGLYVIMSHSGGWRSFYGYLSRIDVAPGDVIEAGNPIGRAGDSGTARSPRLHFVLIQNGDSVDPLDYLY